jgi:hypothetical protein
MERRKRKVRVFVFGTVVIMFSNWTGWMTWCHLVIARIPGRGREEEGRAFAL